MKTIGLAVILLTACVPHTAIIDGQSVPRPTLGYSDHQLYVIEHHDAYPRPIAPGEGKWTYGGSLVGTVCGVDVVLFADYCGKYLSVDGYYHAPFALGKAEQAVRYAVSDQADGRHIEGVNGVELVLSPQAIDGTFVRAIGVRTLHLRARGDDSLYGTFAIFGWEFPFLVRGAHLLWSMPAEDQAAILPLMLTCPSALPDDHGGRIAGFDLTGEAYHPRHRPQATEAPQASR